MAPRAGRPHGASEILCEVLSSRRALPEAGAHGGERNEGRAVAEFVRCRAGWSCDVGESVGGGGQGLSVAFECPSTRGNLSQGISIMVENSRRARFQIGPPLVDDHGDVAVGDLDIGVVEDLLPDLQRRDEGLALEQRVDDGRQASGSAASAARRPT